MGNLDVLDIIAVARGLFRMFLNKPKGDPFWCNDGMIFTKVDGDYELFEWEDFFDKAKKLIDNRSDAGRNYDFEWDFKYIGTGYVKDFKRWKELSFWLYDELIRGRFNPLRDHYIKGPISFNLLHDFVSAVVYNDPIIGADFQYLFCRLQSDFAIVIFVDKRSWLGKKLKLEAKISTKYTILSKDIKSISGNSKVIEIKVDTGLKGGDGVVSVGRKRDSFGRIIRNSFPLIRR